MRRVRWTNEAFIALVVLPEPIRALVFQHLELVAQFPLMYPMRQRGRFAGLRYFVLRRRWLVYYRAAEDSIVVLAVVPAVARPK